MDRQIVQAIRHIASNNSRLHKEAALKQFADLKGFKEVMHFIYNPYIKTGIAAKKLINGKHNCRCDHEATFEDLINHFAEYTTGDSSSVFKVWSMINSMPAECQDIAKAIATKDLKIGVTATTLNKIYGKNFIPKIGVMLAEKYHEQKTKVKGPFIVTEKLDGIRRILVKHNGNVTLYSRSGIEDEGLIEIVDAAKQLPDDMVYDGELLAKGEFRDCIAQRQATNSIANRKGTRTGVVFHIFDMVPYKEFITGKGTTLCSIRKLTLAKLFGDAASCKALGVNIEPDATVNSEVLTPVSILGLCDTESEVQEFAEPIWARKGEGVMLNTFNGTYDIKRSKNILKVKSCESYDLRVVGFQEGTGKYEGALGALIVDYKGSQVGVGSGFTDHDRLWIWDNKSEVLGKIVEIDCFGESTNMSGGTSLNCPIFRGIRYDKEVK